MAEVISMPKLGFDMAEGTLVRWIVSEGESVAMGAVLAEIETDKATVEVESSYAGVVLRHLVAEGDIVPVNTPIAVLGEEGEQVDLQELVGEMPAPTTSEGADSPTPQPPTEESKEGIPFAPAVQSIDEQLPGGLRASPLARRMAQDMGINLGMVKGSGPSGRIVKKDIETFVTSPTGAPPAGASETVTPRPSITPPPAMADIAPRPTQREALPRLRTLIGRRMTEAKQQVPHFYVTHEYDVGALMSLRAEFNQLLPDGEKVSVNDFIVKAVSLALRQFPNLNASLDSDHVVRHGQVNIGVAVAVEGGLLTVVCHDTDQKSLRQIALEMQAMVGRARSGKVRPDDIEGSTFSVSNMGMYDVEHFIAIINPPEAAILAVGSARQVPVVVDGAVVPGWRMKATLSVDHRISDGAEAAQFLQSLASYLEAPLRLVV